MRFLYQWQLKIVLIIKSAHGNFYTTIYIPAAATIVQISWKLFILGFGYFYLKWMEYSELMHGIQF